MLQCDNVSKKRRARAARRPKDRVPRGALLLALALAASIIAAPVSTAQPKERKGGTIAGRVVNGNTDKPVDGVVVTLTGARSGEGGEAVDPIKKTTRTDKKGRFEFRGLPAGSDRFYAVDARFEGGFFAGGVVSVENRDVVRTTLRVWKTTTDPGALLVRRDDMFVSIGEGDVDIVETFRLVNPSKRAYIGRAPRGERTPNTASFSIPLPAGAFEGGVQIVEADIDVPELVRTDAGVGITVAIPPGQVSISISYQVPGEAGSFDLSRTAQYETSEASVFVEDPLVVRSDRLQPGGNVVVGGNEYTQYATTDVIDAGDAVQVLAVAEAGSTSTLLVAGVVVVLVLLLAFAFFSFRRARGDAKPSAARRRRPSRVPREELLTAIASLDLDYEAGRISQEQWSVRRDRLKRALGAEPPATSEALTDLPTVEEPPPESEPAPLEADDLLASEDDGLAGVQPLDDVIDTDASAPEEVTPAARDADEPPPTLEPEESVDRDLPPLETERHTDSEPLTEGADTTARLDLDADDREAPGPDR